MTRILQMALTAVVALGLSACVLRTGPRHQHHTVSKRSSGGGCAPSHYWDGNQCRHKGKGHGARKHDY